MPNSAPTPIDYDNLIENDIEEVEGVVDEQDEEELDVHESIAQFSRLHPFIRTDMSDEAQTETISQPDIPIDPQLLEERSDRATPISPTHLPVSSASGLQHISSPVYGSATSQSTQVRQVQPQIEHPLSTDSGSFELTESEQQTLYSQAKARNRITSKYGKQQRVRVFKSGDFGMLSVSRPVVPWSTSLPRIPCRILAVIGNSSYRVRTQWGVLDHAQPTELINPLSETTNLAQSLLTEENFNSISLDRLMKEVRQHYQGTTSTRIWCKCRFQPKTRKRCTSKHCPCKRAHQSCTNNCHGELGFPLAKQDDCVNTASARSNNPAIAIQDTFDIWTTTATGSATGLENQQVLRRTTRKRRAQNITDIESTRGRPSGKRVRFTEPLAAEQSPQIQAEPRASVSGYSERTPPVIVSQDTSRRARRAITSLDKRLVVVLKVPARRLRRSALRQRI
ncbi:hypothetical protein BJ508DRAFT_328244 [Ascobolus immersus RN42]|uniref:Uncharacterized protein n=1 Tax=Ascobolus immersus RN42 TaxID=1160509 RepID=A0A3N4I5Y7_ASCIM|nr:hypothetical protein BJ508DRAFT_328244 [Ascobolus immersus RN42]